MYSKILTSIKNIPTTFDKLIPSSWLHVKWILEFDKFS